MLILPVWKGNICAGTFDAFDRENLQNTHKNLIYLNFEIFLLLAKPIPFYLRLMDY